MNMRNGMVDGIKANYGVAFEGGIEGGEVMKRETGFEIEEREVG